MGADLTIRTRSTQQKKEIILCFSINKKNFIINNTVYNRHDSVLNFSFWIFTIDATSFETVQRPFTGAEQLGEQRRVWTSAKIQKITADVST